MSAGVPVEVCRVIADEPKKSLKALEKLKRQTRVKSEIKRGVSEELDEVDDEAEGEWKYESGEEGKAEGRWEHEHDKKRRRVTA